MFNCAKMHKVSTCKNSFHPATCSCNKMMTALRFNDKAFVINHDPGFYRTTVGRECLSLHPPHPPAGKNPDAWQTSSAAAAEDLLLLLPWLSSSSLLLLLLFSFRENNFNFWLPNQYR